LDPTTKDEFLSQLEQLLPSSVNKKEIIREWELHIDEALEESPEAHVIEKLGHPAFIAQEYREITPVQKSWIVPFYIGCNALFFIFGSLLTLAYHMTDHLIAKFVWESLIQVAPVIIGGYLLFWVFLGFEIGRTYGVRGRKILTKTVLFSMLPNITLMVLTLYKWIPTDLFSPLLTPLFVLLCVIFTFLVYPICRLAYRVGISRSL
jgi:hypothetical protein